MFENRRQAGELLAEQLKSLPHDGFGRDRTVVVALPRGGVLVGAELAIKLGCPLDVLVSKKIGAPDNPELAVGAVTSGGQVVFDERIGAVLSDKARVQQQQCRESGRLMTETRQLEENWIRAAGMTCRLDLSLKRVILVDDGIATGMTTLAALADIKLREAGQVVLAVPVVPLDTYTWLKMKCDYLVALTVDPDFTSVGAYYHDFHQAEDHEVIAALKLAGCKGTG